MLSAGLLESNTRIFQISLCPGKHEPAGSQENSSSWLGKQEYRLYYDDFVTPGYEFFGRQLLFKPRCKSGGAEQNNTFIVRPQPFFSIQSLTANHLFCFQLEWLACVIYLFHISLLPV